MDVFFLIVAMIAIVGVVFSLMGGIASMTQGTPKAAEMSQKMMRFRVTCQFIALASLFLAYLTKG